ncbi:hypothetical protein NDU88_007252 [Pleurodeles waltl]|uniref:Uncharacterized protein n=1 Tax=Pleurodeles waltl TaxID=8319 RepID=A0AAV7WFN0_PLEWA|nr:hypothetical protein NDU88_007252 [Pleurodeles waltl]
MDRSFLRFRRASLSIVDKLSIWRQLRMRVFNVWWRRSRLNKYTFNVYFWEGAADATLSGRGRAAPVSAIRRPQAGASGDIGGWIDPAPALPPPEDPANHCRNTVNRGLKRHHYASLSHYCNKRPSRETDRAHVAGSIGAVSSEAQERPRGQGLRRESEGQSDVRGARGRLRPDGLGWRPPGLLGGWGWGVQHQPLLRDKCCLWPAAGADMKAEQVLCVLVRAAAVL